MRVRALLASLYLLAAGGAAALGDTPFPTRAGETGLLDVPDAEVAGFSGGGLIGAELRFDAARGVANQFGALPLSYVFGMGWQDLGFAVRPGGRPGDPHPSQLLFTGSVKRMILVPGAFGPGVAVDATVDRLNGGPVLGSRLILSTRRLGPLKLAGYLGGESIAHSGRDFGLTSGFAASVLWPRGFETVADAAAGPRGPLFGGALRWIIGRETGLSLGVDVMPRDHAVRVSLGVGLLPWFPKNRPGLAPGKKPEEEPEEEEKPGEVVFLDDRPHFRLRLHVRSLEAGAPRHLQYAEYLGPLVAAAGPAKAAQAPARPAAPSAEDMLEAQLRDQEAGADAREKRLRATEESLASRESGVTGGAKKLDARGEELALREQQLDERERRIRVHGAVPAAERQLEAREAQLGSSERQLLAQARGFQPSIDAASGREKDATQRAAAELGEREKLLSQANQARSRGEQLDLKKQALGARQRQLAAEEARLVAKGEGLDALERQLRAREEQLDTWQRRLDTKAERLDLLELRAAEQKRPKEAPKAPAEGASGAKDKAVFVMVVKSPTAIMKEPQGKAAGASEPAAPLHPGVAVEKAVAAATVVYFPTPASQLSELDREGLENIARLAAKEGCEVLVWARAKDPGLVPEATRRSNEVKALLMKGAPVAEKQVVTRITTRPGAQGVDVVVSALRTGQRPAAAPAAEQTGAGELGLGETAKRQLREAVQAHQADIERCIGVEISRRKLESAELLLKLTVDAGGKVSRADMGEGPLSANEVRGCLGEVAKGWKFPQTGVEYVVDVPITVVAPGKKP